MKKMTRMMMVSGLILVWSFSPVFADNRVPASKKMNPDQTQRKDLEASSAKKMKLSNRVPASKRIPGDQLLSTEHLEPGTSQKKITTNRVPASKKINPNAVLSKNQGMNARN